MTQHVLVLPREKLKNFYCRKKFYHSNHEISYARRVICEHGRFIDRRIAEKTEEFKQIIAVGVVRSDAKLLCIRRTKKSNRRALKLRWTIMIGGHVDDNDEDSSDPTLNCLTRELGEEVGIIPDKTPELVGIAVDPENWVGRLHVGFVFDVQVNTAKIQVARRLDNLEFTNAKSSNEYNFMDEHEIKSRSTQLDPWSHLYVSSEIPRMRYHWSQQSHADLELPLRWS